MNSHKPRFHPKKYLDYDPETGVFTWKWTRGRATEGEVAGTKNWNNAKKGPCIMIGLEHKRYPAHRLAVLYMTGEWPDTFVEHKNGDRCDNRWENLVVRELKNPRRETRRKKPVWKGL